MSKHPNQTVERLLSFPAFLVETGLADSPAWGPERHPRTDLPSLSGSQVSNFIKTDSSHMLPSVFIFSVFQCLPMSSRCTSHHPQEVSAAGRGGLASRHVWPTQSDSAFGDISLAEKSSGAEASHIFQHLICKKSI